MSNEGGEAGQKFPPKEVKVAENRGVSNPEKKVEGNGETLPKSEGEAVRTVDGGDVYRPADIPVRVLADLMEKKPGAIETPGDVEFGLRKSGKGNNAWYVKTLEGETYKVAYGGRGVSGASVKKESE